MPQPKKTAVLAGSLCKGTFNRKKTGAIACAPDSLALAIIEVVEFAANLMQPFTAWVVTNTAGARRYP